MPPTSDNDRLQRELEQLRAALEDAREDRRLTEDVLAMMLDSLKSAVERSKAAIRRPR